MHTEVASYFFPSHIQHDIGEKKTPTNINICLLHTGTVTRWAGHVLFQRSTCLLRLSSGHPDNLPLPSAGFNSKQSQELVQQGEDVPENPRGFCQERAAAAGSMRESGYTDIVRILRLHGTTLKRLALLRLILKALFSFSGLFIHAASLWAAAGLSAPCLTQCLLGREQGDGNPCFYSYAEAAGRGTETPLGTHRRVLRGKIGAQTPGLNLGQHNEQARVPSPGWEKQTAARHTARWDCQRRVRHGDCLPSSQEGLLFICLMVKESSSKRHQLQLSGPVVEGNGSDLNSIAPSTRNTTVLGLSEQSKED